MLSLLAAFAVLLGALEHEDLILQGTAPATDTAETSHSAVPAVSPGDTDSGTEGTFRFHLSRLWLSPPAERSRPVCIVARLSAQPAAVIRDQRLALAGHVALRL